MTPSLTRDQVIDALRTVNDPELHRDLVSLGMVKDVAIEGGIVRVNIELTTPACPLKGVISGDVSAALEKIPGFEDVIIDFTADVRGRAGAAAGDLVPGVRNVIAVGSGKGGVGKSTVSLNLALALARSGASVGLLDADIYGPNIPLMLGINERPRVRDNKMVPIEIHGLKMISMGLLLEGDAPVIWRGPMLNNALRQFLGDVHWGELDYLIIDMPPGTGDVQISLVQLVPLTGAVIVTTPQDVSLQDARRAMAMFHQTNTPVLGIVENMAYFKCDAPGCGKVHYLFGEGGGERTAREMDLPFLGRVPLGQNVREGGDHGRPVTVADPTSEHALQFIAIAGNLASRVSLINIENAGEAPLQINLGPR
jgi:ATP-binding protein involved in chromosome partitioning